MYKHEANTTSPFAGVIFIPQIIKFWIGLCPTILILSFAYPVAWLQLGNIMTNFDIYFYDYTEYGASRNCQLCFQ